MKRKHNKHRKKKDSNPCTKSMLMKHARRYLKKHEPEYRARKAIYDTEFSVWFIIIESLTLKMCGSLEYDYNGYLVKVEVGLPMNAKRTHIRTNVKWGEKVSFSPGNWRATSKISAKHHTRRISPVQPLRFLMRPDGPLRQYMRSVAKQLTSP